MSSKRIVFINQSSGYLMIDIINAFVDEGYECILIAGSIIEGEVSLKHGVKIEKISKYKRDSSCKRISSWLISSFQIWWKIKFKYKKETLFIVTNPPTAPLLPLFVSNPYYQLVFDLDLNRVLNLKSIKKSKQLTKYWSKIMVKVFSNAINVFTITEGMGLELQPYVKNQNVTVVPLWSDHTNYSPIDKEENLFIKNHQELKDKFIVMYSGNIGVNSGIEYIIELAKQIDNPNIQFLIIGEGLRKQTAMEKVEEFGLKNCVFMTWQDSSILAHSLSSADLAIVSLIGSESKRSIPSKLFRNMSVGNTILGLADHDSDLAKLINKHAIGKTYTTSEIESIIAFINDLYTHRHLLNIYSQNALEASKLYTSKNTKIIIENL